MGSSSSEGLKRVFSPHPKNEIENCKLLEQSQSIAKIGSWYLDLESEKLTWSAETFKIFEIDASTPVTYRDFLSFVHPDDQDYVNEAWKTAAKGSKYNIEHRIVVNGKTKWVHERAEVVAGPSGQIVSAFGAVHDITDRMEAQLQLQQVNSNLRKALEEIAVLKAAIDEVFAVTIANAKGEIEYINSMFTTKTGYEQIHAIGKTHNLLNSGYHSAGFYQNLWQTITSGKIWKGRIRDKTRDGSIIWFYTIIIPESDEATLKPLKYYAFMQEITAEKEKEQEILGVLKSYLSSSGGPA